MLDPLILRRAWQGELSLPHPGFPDWPEKGFAIEGDFSGIQRFVMRPVPGAGGAARRLRARSFRVLALTKLVAHCVEEAYADVGARVFYSAGGRFVVVARTCSDGQARLAALQTALDDDLLREYRGELTFHLAGAEFADGRMPRSALDEMLGRRKLMPLSGALTSGAAWRPQRFLYTFQGGGRCDGCAGTERLRAIGDENLCHWCITDRDLGSQLLREARLGLVEAANGPLKLLGRRWAAIRGGNPEISYITHAPLHDRELATFEDLAALALGRQYLGFLRIDADRIGAAFGQLDNQPIRVWGLSRLLDGCFTRTVDDLLSRQFPHVYPVYGGGDDLFVIGPWQDVLMFASALRREFRAITGDQLTFSAGVALAKKKQHILTKSDEADHALNTNAKSERDSIHALGATMRWDKFEKALEVGRTLAELHGRQRIRSAILHNILELHGRWKMKDARWHSLLFYQVERNLREASDASEFVRRAFLSPDSLWPEADFVVRYALLAKGGEGRGD